MDRKNQILYEKTDFNRSLICQLPGIFKCCKCKKNNTIIVEQNTIVQACLFCGTPNYTFKSTFRKDAAK